MAAPNTIDEAIERTALNPRRVRVGDQIIEMHELESLIAASQYTAATNATSKTHFGIRFTKLVPPSAG